MILIDKTKIEAFGATCKSQDYMDGVKDVLEYIDNLPTVDVCPKLREKALLLLVTWAEECGFGYDNFPEEYETYKDEIEGMGYIDGMIYIAERVVENETD